MVGPFTHTQDQQNTRSGAVARGMRKAAHTVRYHPGGANNKQGVKGLQVFSKLVESARSGGKIPISRAPGGLRDLWERTS